MSRRGRPPYPDVLTPREWEVLALLREGLSDQAIADQLSISVGGAKYHVREILSKLGVSSRQEAAAWEPEERAPARRWLALPLAARIAGALVVAPAVAGLGVLAWGVLRTDGEHSPGTAGTYDTTPKPTRVNPPPPIRPPRFTRDQALVAIKAGRGTETLELVATSFEGARASLESRGIHLSAQMPPDETVWLGSFTGIYPTPFGAHECHESISITADVSISYREFSNVPGPINTGLKSDACTGARASNRDIALAEAAWALGSRLSDIPTTIIAEELTYSAALARLQEDIGQPTVVIARDSSVPVWYVSMGGEPCPSRFGAIWDPQTQDILAEAPGSQSAECTF